MSDLAEIRRTLESLRDIVTGTARDVSWIKAGMDEQAKALKEHVADDQRRLGKLERRQSWLAGAAAVLGAGFTAAVDYFKP